MRRLRWPFALVTILAAAIPTMPGFGARSMLLVTGGETEYSARFTSLGGILHCAGARSTEDWVMPLAGEIGNRRIDGDVTRMNRV